MTDEKGAAASAPLEELLPLEELKTRYAEALDALKALSDDEDEITLLRVAHSRKGDVKECIARWGATLTWRQTNDVSFKDSEPDVELHFGRDSILRWCPIAHEYSQIPSSSNEKVQFPVSFIYWGAMNVYQLIGNLPADVVMEDQIRILMKTLKSLNQQSKDAGHLIRGIYIVDLEGVSLDHIGNEFLSYIKPLFELAQKHFPELISKVIFVKAPMTFPVGWNAMSPFLAEGTQAKCVKLGWEFQKELFQMIPQKYLPTYLDGTNTKQCFVNYEEDFQVEFIEARSKFVQEQQFDPSKHETVQWEFRTEKHDIKFGLVFTPDEGKEEVIVTPAKVDSYRVLSRADYTPSTRGTLRFQFDNGFSLLTSKALIYKIVVVPKAKK